MLNDLVIWFGEKFDALKAFGLGVVVDVSHNNIMEWSASSWATLAFFGVAIIYAFVSEKNS